jgi:transposase InsO family protein
VATTPGANANPASTVEKMPNLQTKSVSYSRAIDASIGVHVGAHVSMQNCMHKGFIALGNGSLVSCENWSWWQNVRATLPVTTKSEEGAAIAPNLLQQDFHADQPHQKWTTDTTYIWTPEGWVYLAVVLDLFSRMVVGWSLAALQDAPLVVNALEMALARRRPQAGLLHHSDRGSISTSESSLALLQHNAMTVSMSRTANCYDNAVTEAFASRASKVNVLIRSPFSPVLRLVIAPLSLLKLLIIELVDIPPYST